MKKAKFKTTVNDASVSAYLNSVKSDERRRDAKLIDKIMREITGKSPRMWGKSIVGYGSYHYKYKTGREGDWMRTGFSVRKANLTIYIMPGYQDYGSILKKLGPHTLGKSCLYIKKMDDIHIPTLKNLIKTGLWDLKKLYKN